MQPTLYSEDSISWGKQLISVVHLAVVFCCVRVASPNGESGIGQAGVCNNWWCVSNIVPPSIGHPLLRWLWVYEAGEVHSGSNGVWTTGRICDYCHWVHRIWGGHTSINVSVLIISTMSIENFVPHNLFTSVLVKFLSSKILIDYILTDQWLHVAYHTQPAAIVYRQYLASS